MVSSGASLSSAGSMELRYYKSRGRAEMLRLALAEAGIAYTNVFVPEEQGSAREAALQKCRDMGGHTTTNIPLLSIDGAHYTQTLAILRKIGRMSGRALYPDHPATQYRIDMIIDACEDFRQPCLGLGFSEGGPQGPGKQEVRFWFEYVSAPPHLQNFARLLGDSPYFCGSEATIADLLVYDVLANLVERMVPGMLARYPPLPAFVERIASRPAIKAWLESEVSLQIPFWTEKGAGTVAPLANKAGIMVSMVGAAKKKAQVAILAFLAVAALAFRRRKIPAPLAFASLAAAAVIARRSS